MLMRIFIWFHVFFTAFSKIIQAVIQPPCSDDKRIKDMCVPRCSRKQNDNTIHTNQETPLPKGLRIIRTDPEQGGWGWCEGRCQGGGVGMPWNINNVATHPRAQPGII